MAEGFAALVIRREALKPPVRSTALLWEASGRWELVVRCSGDTLREQRTSLCVEEKTGCDSSQINRSSAAFYKHREGNYLEGK